MQTEFAISGHWAGAFDEPGMIAWAASLRAQLSAPKVSLGLVFMTPGMFEHAEEVLEIIRVHAQVPLLAGCSSTGLIVGGQEMENTQGLVLGLYHLPGSVLRAVHFDPAQVTENTEPADWHRATGVGSKDTHGWLVFADPFQLDAEAWVRQWNAAYPGKAILGGMASGDMNAQRTQVYLDGQVFEEGGVAVSVSGAVELVSVIAQGCMPIGDTWTITRAERNFIHQIGNRPAYEVLVETWNGLPETDQKKLRGNLFIGLAVNEYLEEFNRGDFLIRTLMGADPKQGVLAVAALPRAGQTVQFQRRDADAATEEMAVLLNRAKSDLSDRTIYGASLHCCNGRGMHLFGQPDHDAAMVQEQFGPLGLTGFFCNGEIGPVGGKNYLHGYTASLALFVKR